MGLNHGTYPNLGHTLSPSDKWVTTFGPIEEYVLQDLFKWLESQARDVCEEIQ
jgi:hypothetical protein